MKGQASEYIETGDINFNVADQDDVKRVKVCDYGFSLIDTNAAHSSAVIVENSPDVVA